MHAYIQCVRICVCVFKNYGIFAMMLFSKEMLLHKLFFSQTEIT